MEALNIIISLVLVFLAFPFLGSKIYPLKNSKKKFFSAYFIGIAILLVINIIFSTSINLSKAGLVFIVYGNEVFSSNFNLFFLLMLIFYAVGGLGFFGGLAEKTGEYIENVDLYSTLEQRRLSPKKYVSNLAHGYLFIYGIYAFNQIIMILLGMQYKSDFTWLGDIFNLLQFNRSLYVTVIGITFFAYKSFKFGFFTSEYFNKNPNPNKMNITPLRVLRKLIAIFFFVIGCYLATIVAFIERYNLSNPFGETEAFDALQMIFFITLFLESLYFYTQSSKLVDALKTTDKSFKVKTDEGIKASKITDEFGTPEKKKEKEFDQFDSDEDITFDS